MEVHKKTQHSLRPASRHKPACTTAWKKWLWSIAFIAPLLPSTVFADTYADTFASGTYTGSTGTLTWPATDWTGQTSNEGSVDIEIDLASLSWLQYDWFSATGDLDDAGDPDGVADNPEARITFGTYRGHDRIIYWEEIQ